MKTNETCKWCDREIVDVIPKSSGAASCGGCHKKIYGISDEDCRQVIFREDYENTKCKSKR